MTKTPLNNFGDLREQRRFLEIKIQLIEQKRRELLEEEHSIRAEIQHVENQIFRLKKAQGKSQQ